MNLFTNQFYPLHQDNEQLLFQISSIPMTTTNNISDRPPPPHDQNHKIIINQDMLLLSPSPPPPSASIMITKQKQLQDINIKKRHRIHNKGVSCGDKHEDGGSGIHHENNNKRKKLIMHRDVERRRRQEMASLYKSLRSLLPLQHLKGKRSMGDHMHEATNYIRHLEKKIKELNEKRDRLKRLSLSTHNVMMSSTINPEVVKMKSFCRSDQIVITTTTVQQCLSGIEVVISCNLLGFEGGGGGGATVLSLSKVLDIIVQEGLDVISCISTKVSETLFHTILSEVRNPNDTDHVNIEELQQTLARRFDNDQDGHHVAS